MSTEAIASPSVTVEVKGDGDGDARTTKPTGLHSPPESNNALIDGSDSELSDLDDVDAEHFIDVAMPRPAALTPEPVPEDDIGEIVPDHYSGTVPVFKPTMKQFQDFKVFMGKIDSYGMKSGIVKIIPPEEWKAVQPELHDLIKQIRVRDPIKQEIMGSNGTYRQVNILHQRSYNLPQWRQLCDQSEHQPPARRGERRANAEKPKPRLATRSRTTASSSTPKSTPTKAKRGRPTRRSMQAAKEETAELEDRPMTPVSPKPEEDEVIASVEQDPGVKQEDQDDDTPIIRRMGGIAKPKTQSTSARRKYIRREGSAMIDEAAFKDFDYKMDVSEYTPERCEELERTYWRTLTYAPPLYGADLPGSLFPPDTDIWNLNKLPNLLDVLGTKVPGVNTAYLYLGMWKATFAWHLEDVDLYSINYLHFGAPKQWYSISQGDARRFEAAMKNIWPTEAKACDQFLRHKGFLISPAHLKQHYNITVNKCVSYPGEFVVTYPYGYHSGYNLGYNCAEAVNFALDSWLPMGKIAKRCQCAQAQDSVWVDVYEIERKLRGEETEFEETEDEDEEEEEDDDTGLPTPPSCQTIKIKTPHRKRKRAPGDKEGRRIKKIRIRPRVRAEPPCCLCPNDIPGAEVLPTDDGRKAHRMCALFVPETYIETVDNKEIIANAAGINKARLELKCLYCRSKKGACFQCSQKKCARSYHATCAAAAGVFVEEAEVPVFGEDGTEYKEQAFEFSCRFHRVKRDKKLDGDALESDARIREAANALKKGDTCQMQFYRGDIFAGVVVENHHDEQVVLLDVIPGGERVEVEWKWLLLPDPSEYRLPKASAKAIPMPTSKKAKDQLNARRPVDELPRKDDVFVEGFTWAEFHTGDAVKNHAQARVDLVKEDQIWFYLGKTSTESKAQYTDNVARPQHNSKSNFLASIPKPPTTTLMPPPPQPKRLQGTSDPSSRAPPGRANNKPYVYKPRQPVEAVFSTLQFSPHKFVPSSPAAPAVQKHMLQRHQQLAGPRPPLPALQQLPLPVPHPRTNAPPPSFSSSLDRFAPVGGSNGFPQLPGLTRPPAHMTSGHHSQIPPTAHSSTSAPDPMPMTSMVSKSPGVARPVSTYQKYSFFQVHHNRDSTRYRSPYAAWGGFTNGYEGNFRAFIMKAQHSLSGKNRSRSLGFTPRHRPGASNTDSAAGAGMPSCNQPRQVPPPGSSLALPHSACDPGNSISKASISVRQDGSSLISVGTYSAGQTSSTPLHPAIRPQYGATWQQNFDSRPNPDPSHGREQSWGGAGQPATTPGELIGTPALILAPTKPPSFAKQSHSPIPLPPYVQQPSRPPPTGPKTAFPAAPNAMLGASPTAPFFSENQVQMAGHAQKGQSVWVDKVKQQPARDPGGACPELKQDVMQTGTPVPLAVQSQLHVPLAPESVYGKAPTAASRWDAYQNTQTGGPSAGPKELPEVPADSTTLLEQMMANLRRASERDARISS